MVTGRNNAGGEPTPVKILRKEIGRYLGAQMQRAARKAGTRLSDATARLAEEDGGGDGGGGAIPKIGSRILHGENPLKAVAAEKVSEKAEAAKSAITDKAKEVLPGGDGSATGDQSGDTKATNIIEMIDVGVPLRTAYDHWTEFETFSGFTKGVQEAERGDDATSEWTVKVGPSTRQWKATVQEQLPDDRIVWTSEGAMGTTQGAVSFHEITPTLTRIVLVMVYYPSGVMEKTGNVWRAQGRRVRLDLKHFQRFVTFADEEAEGWRGEIRGGEVVRTHEDAMADEEGEAKEGGEEEGREEEGGEKEGGGGKRKGGKGKGKGEKEKE
ncbi:SRPBCC family protein [Streptomyces odontomachi]|uniref:SRPBCC family protein n=1 Tax=Streptomyces odontomachi TaxID=2944940 RepID=UPI002109DABA|nr:SRPBCC family protein [Streptomyces sp. ODS25]